MANYTLSCIKDVDGNAYNIKAKGLENQVTLALTGDVTGTQTTTFDTGTTTSIAATIGSEAVTTSKIAASAVTTAKIADLNVTLDKLATSVMSGSVADNDGKLSTHSAVKTYVDLKVAEAASSSGRFLGSLKPSELNELIAGALTRMSDYAVMSEDGTVEWDGGFVQVVSSDEVVQTESGAWVIKPSASFGISVTGEIFNVVKF